ncbi:MAG: YebC/PmpR family DNA-binding transcriptional regulator [Candidatus Levybacteria bacterium CG_4_9_14_3_um_filter_35_16]|nr:MAG: YebC/PmpR family DNA-binding transcriptional regulator [Candidatus Levybacteria bacterium CG22_combo_CG10-13_8_21_14_all_35_11]PJA91061.1 MAG: YebC/PmpR family DNA-binding transcriptional regulator [Candidatus Levybacteria bacterium CG_4_9_14_3_um_filter_35_16]PJC54269.1 MAG: YebC/PmpR family DNA-binding transcriptional regulator [Candidatus Levybacteria bacterium CG_4_9_14_0_2_um_filter_35_21]
MSGHSKWSTIKRQKGITDAKRGLIFTKLSNAITIAVKQGGGIGDPTQNFRLRLAMDAAKTANMPKDNVERAIKRVLGKEAGDLEEVVYEGFAPGGVSLIIEATTDNSQRTTSLIKSVFNKTGGNFGQPGSVAYQFKQVGQIGVKKEGKTFDDIFALAAESGAEDVEDLEKEVLIYTAISELIRIKDKLVGKGIEVIDSQVIRKPIVKIEITDDVILSKIGNFIDAIEDLEDVQKVYSNIA